KPPRALRAGVPRVLEAVCLKCLEKDPARRYATAAELADDLDRWSRNEPTRARPEGRLGATWRWLRRHPTATLATVALLAILLVLFIFPPASPERRRKAALRELTAGRPVTWLGEAGPPPWLHWAAGEDTAAPSKNPRKPFALQTLSLALAEMLPEIPSDRYRFRVQVKHEDAGADGTVGIYFGHQSYETPQGVEHYFFELAFSDRAPGSEQLPLALRFRRYREGEGDKNNRKHLIRLKKVAVAPPHPGD